MIEPRLKNTGAMAGIAKLLRAFNMPIAFAAERDQQQERNHDAGQVYRQAPLLPGTSKKPGASK